MAIGDIHAKVSEIAEINLLTEKISHIIKKTNPDIVIILGDLSDRHDKIDVYTWISVSNLLETVSKLKKTYYIIGNHDLSSNSQFLSEQHFFKKFQSDSLVVVDKPLHEKELNITLCPYVPPGRLMEALSLANWSGTLAVFCHQELLGASFGHISSKVGDEWPDSNPLLVSGHIHQYSWHQKNALYVGTPRQVSQGESDDKSVSLLEFGSDGLISETRIPTDMPRKITITMTCQQAHEFVLTGTDTVRIILEDTEENITKFKKSKKYKELLENVKFLVKFTDQVVTKKNTENKSFIKLLMEYAEKDSNGTASLFREVLDEIKAT